MRMWGVDPKLLCNKHLNGEHYEMHMTSGGISSGKVVNLIKTLCRQGMMDLSILGARHDELAAEMIARGGNHKSPLWWEDSLYNEFDNGWVDVAESLEELKRRCPQCRERILKAEQEYVSKSQFEDSLRTF